MSHNCGVYDINVSFQIAKHIHHLDFTMSDSQIEVIPQSHT